MLKIMGLTLLAACSAGIGIHLSGRLSLRVKQLEEVLQLLELLSSDMRFTLSPMELLIQRAATIAGSLPFVEACSCFCMQGVAFPTAWQRALTESKMALQEDDLQPLTQLGFVLGASDLNGSLGELEHARFVISQRYEEAKERKTKLGGLYQTMGVLAGIAWVILLI